MELDPAFILEKLTEPIANTETASAGEPICFSVLAPSFPADAKTKIPLLKATSAPREIKVVIPFISL